MESFREVHKKRRKALGTLKNSVNCSYLFLIGLKPNLYFSRGIFSSEAKPCPTAELRSAGRLPTCTAKLPRTRTPRLRSARTAKVAGARKPRRTWSGVPSLRPFSLGSARGRHPLPTGSARQGPAASSAEEDGALVSSSGVEGGGEGQRDEDWRGKGKTAVLHLPSPYSRLPTLVERNRQTLASALRAKVRPPLSQKPRRGKEWRRRKSRRKNEDAEGSLPGCDGHSSTPGPPFSLATRPAEERQPELLNSCPAAAANLWGLGSASRFSSVLAPPPLLPAPATAAVITRTADVRVHSGAPCPPLIPGERGLGGGQDWGARQRRLQLLAGTWVSSPQQQLNGPQRGTEGTTALREARSRLFPSLSGSHTETSPGGTISGKSQTIRA